MAIIYTLISVNTWPNSKTDTFFLCIIHLIVHYINIYIYIQKRVLLRTTSIQLEFATPCFFLKNPLRNSGHLPWELVWWWVSGRQGGVSVIYGALEDFPPEKTKIFSPENGVFPLEVKGDSELGILPPFSGGNSLFVSGRVSFKTELDVAGSSNHQSE